MRTTEPGSTEAYLWLPSQPVPIQSSISTCPPRQRGLAERNSFYCHLLRDSTLAPGLGVATCPLNNLWGLDVTCPWSRKVQLSPSTLASGNLRPKSKVSLCICSPEKHGDHTCKAGFVPQRQQALGILGIPPSLLPSANAPARRVALTIFDTE